MKFYITTFYNIRHLKDNAIPISTCLSDPFFFHSKTDRWAKKEGYYINDSNVLLGIREEILSPARVDMSDGCQKDCPHRKEVPECPFLIKYDAWLASIDFDHVLSEFSRTAEEVRKITGYQGEPEIVLLVYEATDNPCSERVALKKLFSAHGIDLVEWANKNDDLPIL